MSMTWDDYLKWLDETSAEYFKHSAIPRSTLLPDPDQPSAAQHFADTGGKVTPKGQEQPPKEYTAPPLSYGDLICADPAVSDKPPNIGGYTMLWGKDNGGHIPVIVGEGRPITIETPEPIHPLEWLGCRYIGSVRLNTPPNSDDPPDPDFTYNVTI